MLTVEVDEYVQASVDRIEAAVARNAVDGPPRAWFYPSEVGKPDERDDGMPSAGEPGETPVIYETVCLGCTLAGDVSMLIEVVTHDLVNAILAAGAPKHVPPLRLYWRARPKLIAPPYAREQLPEETEPNMWAYRMRLALTDLAGKQYRLGGIVKVEGASMAMLDTSNIQVGRA